jgi:hypothetical protein
MKSSVDRDSNYIAITSFYEKPALQLRCLHSYHPAGLIIPIIIVVVQRLHDFSPGQVRARGPMVGQAANRTCP